MSTVQEALIRTTAYRILELISFGKWTSGFKIHNRIDRKSKNAEDVFYMHSKENRDAVLNFLVKEGLVLEDKGFFQRTSQIDQGEVFCPVSSN